MTAKRTAKRTRRTPAGVPTIAESLHNIAEKQTAHELEDNLRFGAIDKVLKEQPTKNDLAATHQEILNVTASKEDLQHMSSQFFDKDGQPKFATKEDMQPVLDLYKGSTFVKSLFAGVGAFIITLVAVGFAIIQLIQWGRGS
jgi:hypothetical protein